MKYMGSKRAMLLNGLGELLSDLVPNKSGFYDLFCGAASVSGFVASRFNVPVFSNDLQAYAVALAKAQVEQDSVFSVGRVLREWSMFARRWLNDNDDPTETASKFYWDRENVAEGRRIVAAAREFCGQLPPAYALTRAYGGYYFSPLQAITLDALRGAVRPQYEAAALAVLVDAASSCAAAPGHTAQPFSTSDGAMPYLCEAWKRDVGACVEKRIEVLGRHVARQKGQAVRANAISAASLMKSADIAFVDPPYSEVQYSRFYHVLESIATGQVSAVFGSGRYPPLSERPQSNFCRITRAPAEFNELMVCIACSGAEAIVTFPAGDASNGLSGEIVEAISTQYFRVRKRTISSLFSTLGGDRKHRDARQNSAELLLHLTPR